MIDPSLKEKILKHFTDPLIPCKPEELGIAADLVEHPTKASRSPGGLSEKGAPLAQLDPEIAAAATSHKEATRIKIHAVAGTCMLFTVSKSRPLNDQEKTALTGGIVITRGGKPDHIKTTRKNGKMLTAEFKDMMADLYRAVRKSLPETAKTLMVAAELQKKEEALEKAATKDIAEMA